MAQDEKAIVRFSRWLAGVFLENWAGLVVIAVSTGGLTWMAQASDFLKPYGPFIYGAVALASFVVVTAGLLIWAHYKRLRALAGFEERRSKSTDINPLDSFFSRKRIRLADLYHPFFQWIEGATFQHCELFGPALMITDACTFRNGTMNDCEVIIAEGQVHTKGAVAFRHCLFESTSFFRVTLIMGRNSYDKMSREASGTPLHIVVEGQAGNVSR